MGKASTTTTRAAQGQAAKQSLRERLAAKQPQTDEYHVVLDEGPLLAVATAENALTLAKLVHRDDTDRIEQLEQELAEAQAAAIGAKETLHLRGLTRGAFEALILKHPPTAEQKAESETYNVDTFSPALVALCVVDPDTTPRPITADDVDELHELAGDDQRAYLEAAGRPLIPADVSELWADWNQGEVGTLYHVALRVSTQPRNPQLPFA